MESSKKSLNINSVYLLTFTRIGVSFQFYHVSSYSTKTNRFRKFQFPYIFTVINQIRISEFEN